MESANVGVLRRLETLFNRRALDEYFELMDPQVEWHVSEEDPDATVHRGRAAVRSYVEGWIGSFADLSLFTKVIGEEDDRVHTHIRMSGRGTESGVPLDQWFAFDWWLRDGRVTRVADLGREGLQLNTK
jgi:ketosteroid isomerase-like protein